MVFRLYVGLYRCSLFYNLINSQSMSSDAAEPSTPTEFVWICSSNQAGTRYQGAEYLMRFAFDKHHRTNRPTVLSTHPHAYRRSR